MNSKRILYLDNLKNFLILLVIIHHSAHAYIFKFSNIPSPDWIIKDYASTEMWLNNILIVNMTFVMSVFFFISGYFIPKSKQNKTKKQFILEKAKRLLIPLLVITILFVPIYLYLKYLVIDGGNLNFFEYYINIYIGHGKISYAHGWFLMNLFIYCIIYLLFEKLIINKKIVMSVKRVLLIIFIMGLLTYLIRKIYPINTWVNAFGFIGFEPAHLMQYIMMFLGGALCYQNNWLEKLTPKIGKVCSILALIMVIMLGFVDKLPSIVEQVVFGLFSFYESAMAVIMLVALIYLFRKYFNKTNRFISTISQSSYGAYIVHYTFVIALQIYFYDISISGNLKFLFVVILSIIFSFIFSFLIKKIPRINKVI